MRATYKAYIKDMGEKLRWIIMNVLKLKAFIKLDIYKVKSDIKKGSIKTRAGFPVDTSMCLIPFSKKCSECKKK